MLRGSHRLLWDFGRGVACALALPALLLCNALSGTATSAPTRVDLQKRFVRTIRPFLNAYCVACHGNGKPEAQLNLSAYVDFASVARDYNHWALVSEKLSARQMPPESFGKRPTETERSAVLAWIRDVRRFEAERNAGDPGPVLARRLSNAEYDNSVRDLTGVDLRPTREFPVDPANQEGFDNSGESLTVSPALMKKYVQAAKEVADCLVLTSSGLEFADHPVLAETDRDKFCILRIVDFYRRQPTDYADYFETAWRYRHRASLGRPAMTLAQAATERKISPRYLELVWKTLNEPTGNVGPIARLQAMWNALPVFESARPDAARAGCLAMRDRVVALRKKLAWKFDNLKVPGGFSEGGQCFVLWKDRQYASHRRKLNPSALQLGGVPKTTIVPAQGDKPAQTISDPVDPDLFLPEAAAERAVWLAAYERFCNVFPDAFYIAERGRMFVDDPNDMGRLLTAGLHNSMGYFRDDTPLMELLLDENGRRTLDRLWRDFDTVAYVPERMHLEFFVYERAESGTITDPEFNFARAEDRSALSDEKIRRLADLYLAKAVRNGGEPPALEAIKEHFPRVSANIRAVEQARRAAEPLHLRALLDFARRAYRRPLTAAERNELHGFYRTLREKQKLTHEDAVRDTLASILVSPHFLFRMDLEEPEPRARSPLVRTALRPTGPPDAGSTGVIAVRPLSDYALASRLSYFLWSSIPDEELLAHAAAGDLHRPNVLTAQARRMLRDPRARALALEFGGNWLDFRRFEEHNAVDRQRFPAFTNELREAMFEEPVRFLTDMFRANRPVPELLYGKHTFVNADLARHYGMADLKFVGKEWIRVADAERYGRGGLLPMAVFLTKNSPGLRTSPVKRGYWVVRRVLGESIPPPPPVVPELPKDESQLGERTLRQALERHRANPACSGCHARFDSYGLVFEGYGPIGETRAQDLGGKPVDVRAPFPGSPDRAGVTGLREYIRTRRQQDFLDNLCRKLLSYGLGRSLQPSDDPTLERMHRQLQANGYRFGTLIDSIITSRPFLHRRAVTTPARKDHHG
ncbi:MAG: DUF1592 domain-containing protein [Capsulimonadales bacterium]|nr:DUF1592 domain-containing protein [Capsulimonadales bacterium]